MMKCKCFTDIYINTNNKQIYIFAVIGKPIELFTRV